MLDVGCWLVVGDDVGCRMLDVGCWWLFVAVVGHGIFFWVRAAVLVFTESYD